MVKTSTSNTGDLGSDKVTVVATLSDVWHICVLCLVGQVSVYYDFVR